MDFKLKNVQSHHVCLNCYYTYFRYKYLITDFRSVAVMLFMICSYRQKINKVMLQQLLDSKSHLTYFLKTDIWYFEKILGFNNLLTTTRVFNCGTFFSITWTVFIERWLIIFSLWLVWVYVWTSVMGLACNSKVTTFTHWYIRRRRVLGIKVHTYPLSSWHLQHLKICNNLPP